ncbi:MAG: phosphatidylinositol mannoside acyltransferase [Acidimicrobiales bacterium]|nr:phosphatidylinositol mannoside acyltransferase [Acidimicrobiales bacterium]
MDPRAVVAAYRTGSAVSRLVPTLAVRPASAAMGRAAARAMAGRRSTLERHLRRVRPELQGAALHRASRAAFASYARYFIESFRIPALSAAEIDAGFSYEGFGLVEDGLVAGQGVIVALSHLGGWEWAGRWIADQGIPITAVVEPLEPPELFAWFAEYRRSLGMTVVPLGAGAGGAVLRALRANEVVCLLCDRDLTGDGVEVEFFGERTTLPPGPATLALRTGAPLLPTAVYFEGEGHRCVVRPPLAVERLGRLRDDVTRVTQDLAGELERLIRAAPEQWHLMQPNWPSDPGYPF